MPEDVVRTYTYARWRTRVFPAVLLGQVACLALGFWAASVSWFEWLDVAGYAVAVGWLAVVWAPRRKLIETADALWFPTAFSMTSVPWSDIERFEPAHPHARIVRRSGQPLVLLVVQTGDRTTWEGGWTDDIIGELNARLAHWTGGAAPVPPTPPARRSDPSDRLRRWRASG